MHPHTHSTVISELQSDFHAVAASLGYVEKSASLHVDAIKRVQWASGTHLSYFLEMHSQLEDLNNDGPCHSIRVSVLPESTESSDLPKNSMLHLLRPLGRLPDRL